MHGRRIVNRYGFFHALAINIWLFSSQLSFCFVIHIVIGCESFHFGLGIGILMFELLILVNYLSTMLTPISISNNFSVCLGKTYLVSFYVQFFKTSFFQSKVYFSTLSTKNNQLMPNAHIIIGISVYASFAVKNQLFTPSPLISITLIFMGV